MKEWTGLCVTELLSAYKDQKGWHDWQIGDGAPTTTRGHGVLTGIQLTIFES